MPTKAVDQLAAITTAALKQRAKMDTKYNDATDVFANFLNQVKNPEYTRVGITEKTAIIQAMEFIFTTYDSTGTVMTLLAYYLAKHPECQDRLIQEINRVSSKSNFTETDELLPSSEMPYMTACFSEAARLAPGFIRAERICTKDWKYNGISIPKGMVVMFPLWAVNRHPEHHKYPDTFNPERFLGEEKNGMNPHAFSTFGHGPKHCPGQRWAYQMNKIILTTFLKEFEIVERDDTKVVWKPGNAFLPQYSPIMVDIVRRN